MKKIIFGFFSFFVVAFAFLIGSFDNTFNALSFDNSLSKTTYASNEIVYNDITYVPFEFDSVVNNSQIDISVFEKKFYIMPNSTFIGLYSSNEINGYIASDIEAISFNTNLVIDGLYLSLVSAYNANLNNYAMIFLTSSLEGSMYEYNLSFYGAQYNYSTYENGYYQMVPLPLDLKQIMEFSSTFNEPKYIDFSTITLLEPYISTSNTYLSVYNNIGNLFEKNFYVEKEEEEFVYDSSILPYYTITTKTNNASRLLDITRDLNPFTNDFNVSYALGREDYPLFEIKTLTTNYGGVEDITLYYLKPREYFDEYNFNNLNILSITITCYGYLGDDITSDPPQIYSQTYTLDNIDYSALISYWDYDENTSVPIVFNSELNSTNDRMYFMVDIVYKTLDDIVNESPITIRTFNNVESVLFDKPYDKVFLNSGSYTFYDLNDEALDRNYGPFNYLLKFNSDNTINADKYQIMSNEDYYKATFTDKGIKLIQVRIDNILHTLYANNNFNYMHFDDLANINSYNKVDIIIEYDVYSPYAYASYGRLQYDIGYKDGINDVKNDFGIGDLGRAIINIPIGIITSFFSFEILGANVSLIILCFITLGLAIWVINKFI